LPQIPKITHPPDPIAPRRPAQAVHGRQLIERCSSESGVPDVKIAQHLKEITPRAWTPCQSASASSSVASALGCRGLLSSLAFSTGVPVGVVASTRATGGRGSTPTQSQFVDSIAILLHTPVEWQRGL
jgi:hypothetical protein